MRLFRLGLFSWSSITDQAERDKKAKELSEARKRINKEYNDRIEPYNDENVLKDSKKAYNGELKTKDGKVKTVKDIEEKARFKRKEAMSIRNREFEAIQDKEFNPKKRNFRKKVNVKPVDEAPVKFALSDTAKKNLKKGGKYLAGGAIIAGTGYGVKKAVDHYKGKKSNDKVRKSIYPGNKKG